MVQQILTYLILAIAVGYLAKKFILPKSLFSPSKKNASKGGGDCGDCGCH